MKILAGKYKGKNFYMPEGIRATQDLVRKAIFDILGNDMEGLIFLDLFAGSGSIGFEAISLGAKEVIFVEHDPHCVETIEESVSLFNLRRNEENDGICEVFETDAFTAMRMFARQGKMFDVIFIDPPYEVELAKKALISLEACVILHPNSFVVVEHSKKEKLPQECGLLKRIKEKRYGNTFLSIYQWTGAPNS